MKITFSIAGIGRKFSRALRYPYYIGLVLAPVLSPFILPHVMLEFTFLRLVIVLVIIGFNIRLLIVVLTKSIAWISSNKDKEFSIDFSELKKKLGLLITKIKEKIKWKNVNGQ